MRTKKIKLENISVSSFITKIESSDKQTIDGAAAVVTNGWPGCISDGGTGCKKSVFACPTAWPCPTVDVGCPSKIPNCTLIIACV